MLKSLCVFVRRFIQQHAAAHEDKDEDEAQHESGQH
jgi:hypothetical protein